MVVAVRHRAAALGSDQQGTEDQHQGAARTLHVNRHARVMATAATTGRYNVTASTAKRSDEGDNDAISAETAPVDPAWSTPIKSDQVQSSDQGRLSTSATMTESTVRTGQPQRPLARSTRQQRDDGDEQPDRVHSTTTTGTNAAVTASTSARNANDRNRAAHRPQITPSAGRDRQRPDRRSRYRPSVATGATSTGASRTTQRRPVAGS